MKHFVLTFTAGLLILAANGQLQEGTITYEQKTDMHKKMPQLDERMKNMFPQFISERVVLTFTPYMSVSKKLLKGDDIREEAGEPRDAVIVPAGGSGTSEVFKDLATGRLVETKELGPRKYLIEEVIETPDWKIDADQTKTIQGYNCKRATATNKEGISVDAWYTEQIPVPTGPETYSGLPGMILELSINHGEIVYTPVTILTKADKAMMKIPTKGKKITRNQYKKLVDDKFGTMPPGGPGATPVRRPFAG